MADHSKPTVTSTYANYTSELDGRLDDLALGLDPATTTPTNVPTNAIRWASASNKWQKWNGSAWGDLSSSYSININGTVGATTPAAGTFTSLTSTGGLTVTNGASVQGLTVGRGAGAVSTNVAIGVSALAANTSGSYGVAVGHSALSANTTGTQNIAIGYALVANTTGINNTAVGVSSMTANSAGGYNTALGTGSLQSNTTASNNTAVGYQAGYGTTTAQYSVFVGSRQGTSGNGEGNTIIGDYAGNARTTATYNTFVGQSSGYLITTGSKNTIIGSYGGNQGGLDIRTASNNIVLSDGDGNPRIRADANGQFYSLITGIGLYADYGCRAWVNFNGTGTVAIRGSGNVSSITDNGTGDYTVNFTNAMPDANYGYLGGAQAFGIANGPMIDMYYGASTTTAARFRVFTQAAAAMDTSYASIAVFR